MTMPDSHLDDEQLSALLDGAAADEHVRACAACRARLEALGNAAALAGSPVAPLAADLVDRIVGRALDAAADGSTVDPNRVVALERFERRSRRAPYPAILGAAAAVLALLLAVPVLVGGFGSSGDDSDTAASMAVEESAGDSASDSLAAEAETADADGGASTQAAGGGAAAVAAPTGDVATRSAAPAAFDTEADLVDHLIAVLSTTPPAEGTDETTPEPPSSCEAAARRVGGTRLGGRTYVAPIRWRATDGEVHVFELTEPVDGATRQAYVMATADCRVLVEPRF